MCGCVEPNNDKKILLYISIEAIKIPSKYYSPPSIGLSGVELNKDLESVCYEDPARPKKNLFSHTYFSVVELSSGGSATKGAAPPSPLKTWIFP